MVIVCWQGGEDKNQIHKEYKVLVMTSGKHRWFAEGSLELMNERR
tara:strand:+ start:1463 stop:1597 length:135 start_codon:yes stop_codon:yes gene_type:complete